MVFLVRDFWSIGKFKWREKKKKNAILVINVSVFGVIDNRELLLLAEKRLFYSLVAKFLRKYSSQNFIDVFFPCCLNVLLRISLLLANWRQSSSRNISCLLLRCIMRFFPSRWLLTLAHAVFVLLIVLTTNCP